MNAQSERERDEWQNVCKIAAFQRHEQNEHQIEMSKERRKKRTEEETKRNETKQIESNVKVK